MNTMDQEQLEHIRWFINTGEQLETADNKIVEVWEFRHENDETVLSEWAKHFRGHYCREEEIDFLREDYGYSRAEYLSKIKLPDKSERLGPSTMAGDFGEILVSDFLQYILSYWVPRTRYGNKTVRNESTKGCDIIGFKIMDESQESLEDTLAIFEAKTQFSGNKSKPRLQDAVNDSSKDQARRGESLNAIKQRLFAENQIEKAKRIGRFQNPEDRPYKEVNGAVAIFNTEIFDQEIIQGTDAGNHPNQSNLKLLVIYGAELMKLVYELYRRTADEA